MAEKDEAIASSIRNCKRLYALSICKQSIVGFISLVTYTRDVRFSIIALDTFIRYTSLIMMYRKAFHLKYIYKNTFV